MATFEENGQGVARCRLLSSESSSSFTGKAFQFLTIDSKDIPLAKDDWSPGALNDWIRRFARSRRRGDAMKIRIGAFLTLCLLAAESAFAQSTRIDEVEGVGTQGYVPVFTGSHKIGNSNIFQSPNGNVGIGWTTPQYPLQIFTNDLPGGLFVQTQASVNDVCAGCPINAILGFVGASSGNVIGVNGQTISPEGNGVLGNFTSTNSQGGGGVIGLTNATSGFSYGARGDALGTSGTAVGVFGQTFSPDGWAAYFVNRASGNIMVGVVSQNPDIPVFRVDGAGKVYANGGFQPNGADFAESMAVTGDRTKYAAGDLLVIDPTASRHLALAQQPYSTLVAGIYSTKPGMLGSTRTADEPAAKDEVPLAVVGIVPCKVTTENGAIQVGDLLVTSSIPGHAMKGTDRTKMLGAVVGKALEPLQQGTGVLLVLVTLQ